MLAGRPGTARARKGSNKNKNTWYVARGYSLERFHTSDMSQSTVDHPNSLDPTFAAMRCCAGSV